jgi:hypothetical protein
MSTLLGQFCLFAVFLDKKGLTIMAPFCKLPAVSRWGRECSPKLMHERQNRGLGLLIGPIVKGGMQANME